MDRAADRIPASSSSTVGVHRRRRSPRCLSVGSRQSAHVPRLVLKVLGLALALGLFGGASHAQTTGPCVATDKAIEGAQAIHGGTADEQASLTAECTALLAFKAALTFDPASAAALRDGSLNWNRNTGMHVWQSIGLNARRSRVTRLTLGPSYKVTSVTGGTLPSLSGLDALTTLRFSFNPDLAATAFPAWVSSLTNLTHLDLQGNNFTGSIPNLGSLTELRVLNLSRNELTGRIPALTGLVKLEKLALSKNKLTGSIPALNGITTLKEVDLNDNNLTGGIPALSALVNLERLNVGNNFRFRRSGVGNNLTGEIPALSTLVKLQQLIVNDNKLTGSIPTLPSGNNLREISAHFNSLTGGIPTITSTGMRVLNLRGNDMTGNINNATVTAAAGITHLHLGSNGFTGAVPAALGNLTNLGHLSLCGNSLTGNLPTATNTRRTSGSLTVRHCLDISDPVANEGEELSFRVTYSRWPLTGSSIFFFNAGLATREGTATAPEDYTHKTESLAISVLAHRSASGTVKVSTKTDCRAEGPETLTFNSTNYPFGKNIILWSYGGTGTINNVAPDPSCPPPPDPDDDDDPDSDPDPDPDPEPEPLDPNRFVAPYWRGTGGIVVKPANGLSVKFEMSCRGARTTETLYANDDGLIVQLVRRDACTDDDGNPVRGELAVRNIEPGRLVLDRRPPERRRRAAGLRSRAGRRRGGDSRRRGDGRDSQRHVLRTRSRTDDRHRAAPADARRRRLQRIRQPVLAGRRRHRRQADRRRIGEASDHLRRLERDADAAGER